ncbi:hypothetical protein G8759_04940 [Spirosoma aureum]|uniref:Oligosaccharide repeat unit polymerase n=1 Tax=Spirosoma aureum TaxID=2692134 RepID=A0A6G9AI59_9BACT|nr:hypothetical protein [Spirosoma aureum]QIP12024.1 hypothetical protein G8759_04940 [Spirosoma aureum]
MYYYEKYDIVIMVLSFLFFSFVLFVLLRRRITSIIDPLVSNIIWCASGLALLTGYFFEKSVNLDGLTFFLSYIIYITGLYVFLGNPSRSISTLESGLNNKKNVVIFFVCIVLNILSRYEFILYAIENPSITHWFFYKFMQWQGRSFWQYILQIGARPFFIYYTFVLLKTKKEWRYYLISVLIINSVLDIIAGGRSSLLGLVEAYGYFIYYFKPLYSNKTVNNLNWYGISFLALSILNSVLVTSVYNSEVSLAESSMHMANRVLSAGDGLEMYLSNNAAVHIKTGIGEYIKAVFGIFIKQIIPIDTQSIGWKLYELEKGIISPISVGPNFILPLQVILIGKLFVIPYTILISFIVAFLRGNKISKKYISSQPLSFVLGLLTFQLVVDAEFFILQLCACLFIYFIFIYPIRKFTFNFDLPLFNWSVLK